MDNISLKASYSVPFTFKSVLCSHSFSICTTKNNSIKCRGSIINFQFLILII